MAITAMILKELAVKIPNYMQGLVSGLGSGASASGAAAAGVAVAASPVVGGAIQAGSAGIGTAATAYQTAKTSGQLGGGLGSSMKAVAGQMFQAAKSGAGENVMSGRGGMQSKAFENLHKAVAEKAKAGVDQSTSKK